MLYKILNGEVNNERSEQTKVLWENSLTGLPHVCFICQNKFFKLEENLVPKLSKETMQALRILTNFGSFRKKWRKVARNKLLNLLVLVIPQSFYL